MVIVCDFDTPNLKFLVLPLAHRQGAGLTQKEERVRNLLCELC